jgi:nanoRNase/pAp phosphatase (c-di-AMP/oligoRNAs hydrolase)
LGNKLALDSGTFGCAISYDGENNEFCYSLRSIGDYDVSIIAKYFGGGGHKNASGFKSNKLIGIVQ